jgi:hypothetical protein
VENHPLSRSETITPPRFLRLCKKIHFDISVTACGNAPGTKKSCREKTFSGQKTYRKKPGGVRRVKVKWGQSMQIKIRQPVAFDVTPAEENLAIRFITENEHEAIVTISRDLLPDLIARLQEIENEDETPAAEPEQPEIAKDDETRRVLLRALSASVTRAA